MTASLYAKALYWGCRQVLLLRCLPPWRRMQLLVLKAVAISGYYAGRLANQWHSLEKVQLPAPAAADSAATANTCTAHGLSFPTGAGSSSQACPCVVVVPAYISTARQAARLQRLVTRLLLEQRQPPSAVAVVDDASPLSAANVLACFQHQPAGAGPLLLVHRLPANHGPAAARNAGLALAAAMGARVVAFTDDDCLPSCDWVGSMLVSAARRRARMQGSAHHQRLMTEPFSRPSAFTCASPLQPACRRHRRPALALWAGARAPCSPAPQWACSMTCLAR